MTRNKLTSRDIFNNTTIGPSNLLKLALTHYFSLRGEVPRGRFVDSVHCGDYVKPEDIFKLVERDGKISYVTNFDNELSMVDGLGVIATVGNDVVALQHNHSTIIVYYLTAEAKDVLIALRYAKRFHKARPMAVPECNGYINLLSFGPHGPGSAAFKLPLMSMDIDTNYNSDFKAVDHEIRSSLSQLDSRGLIILYGHPGTGKSYYIHHLVQEFRYKEFYFIPSHSVDELSGPNFANVIMRHPGSIFIIEDAERALVPGPDGNRSSATSTILNLSDGLLGKACSAHIIATSNLPINKLDPALVRDGRLVAEYCFKELAVDRANKLATKLKSTTRYTQDTALATIYKDAKVPAAAHTILTDASAV